MYKLFWLEIFLCFWVINTKAQSLIFSNLTTDEGLSSNKVYSFLQDKRGFMWVGTKDGLNRYDGTTFQVYKHHRNDTTTLPDNWVVSLAEDKHGNIWIGTWQGVAKMNPYNGKVVRYQANAKQKNTITIDNDNHVFCDSKGKIWVINPHGLFLFREKTQDFECKLDLKAKKEYGISIYEDRTGNFWVGTFEGVYHLNTRDFSSQKYLPFPEKPPINVVLSIKEDINGMIWLAMWGGGVAYFNPNTKVFHAYQPPSKYKGDFIATSFYEQLVDAQHRIMWVAKYGQLLRIDIIDNQYPNDLENAILYTHQPDEHSYLGGEAHVLYVDKEGTIWVGTDQGISRIIAKNQRFSYYPPIFKFGLTQLVYDSTQKQTPFWAFAWYGHESCQLDSNMNPKKRWQAFPPKKSLDAGNISEVAKDSDGNYWFATFDGLVRYDEKKHSFEWFEADKNNPNSLHSNRTTGIYISDNQYLWVSLYNNGISKYSPQKHEWTYYSQEKNCLPSLQVHKIYQDKKQRIWVLTNNGLALYHPENDEFELMDSRKALTYDLFDLIENEDGSFWIGSNQGLLNWNPETNKLTVFSVEEGLDNPHIVDMEKDKQGNLWILTENQLNLFRPQQQIFTHFGKENGFLSENNGACLTQDKYGNLYIGDYANNICKINTRAFTPKNNPLPLYIEAIKINGNPLLMDSQIIDNQIFNLKYYENQLQIEFAAIDFVTGSQIKYACKLENADEDWQEIGQRKFAAYANVPSGKYVFQVKACDAMGNWCAPQRIIFIISPPFWKTNGFIISMIALFLLAFGGLVRYVFTKQLKEKILILEKEQAIEKERNRISKDMHDDIGSGLSKIVIMSEVLQRQQEINEKSQQSLQIISHSASEIIDNMQHIIWFLHSGNDNKARFLSYIREYISKYLENVGIDYVNHFPNVEENWHISAQARRNILLVIKEALNNIAKYSSASLVTIDVECSKEKLIIAITDNGIGFAPENIRPFGNGINNMQERMNAIGGKCEIVTQVGEGTKIKLMIT